MKKLIIALMIAIVLLGSIPAQAATGSGRGGFMGFIAGCCFGIRAGADYNEGKEIHWREWCMLIPYVNIVFAIWNGIDGANGVGRADYISQYGSMFY